MWTLRKIQTAQAVTFLAAQMLGGYAAWQLAQYFTGQELANIAGGLVCEKVGVVPIDKKLLLEESITLLTK